MTFKKVLVVLFVMLTMDLALVGCYNRAYGTRTLSSELELNTTPTAEQIRLASQGTISPYDQLMRQVALEHDMDWRLLAAIAYQESRFNPTVRSSRGAQGLMQVTGSVALQFAVPVEQLADPETNIETAVKLIKRIESSLRFTANTTPEDRTSIMLACYNGGIGHIVDARRLAAKHGVNYNNWNQLRGYVTLKGTPEWVNDEAVRNGAFKGTETVMFVDQVMRKYDHYCENYI